MEGHVVTTSPWLVMAINMTVVFAVLIALGILMKIIYWIDPTKKKLNQLPHLLQLPQLLQLLSLATYKLLIMKKL